MTPRSPCAPGEGLAVLNTPPCWSAVGGSLPSGLGPRALPSKGVGSVLPDASAGGFVLCHLWMLTRAGVAELSRAAATLRGCGGEDCLFLFCF